MTEREGLMYQIIGKISETNAPMVFKGALITKLILRDHNYTATERPTQDIDANWIGSPPTMETLADAVNQSLGVLGDTVCAEIEREYGIGQTAGLRFVNLKNGEQLITMDVEIKPVIGSKLYHYGEMAIRGVLPDAVLGDKISVLSGDRIFRRSKDVLDVYALANCLNVRTADIYNALEKAERVLGTFEAFITRRSDLEHAYNKMRGVIGKPDFDNVYSFLGKFLEPFIQHDKAPKIWHGNAVSWNGADERARQKQRSDRDAR